MSPLRIGVIGVAGIGQAHLFAAKTLPAYELAAVCDIADTPREKAATDFDVPGFNDAASLFADANLDAVVIATPPATHRDLLAGALDAGLHVYCEKPLVTTIAQGQGLAEHAVGAGLVVQVGLQFRFQRSAAKARALITDGEIGEVFRADLTATHWFRPQRYFDAAPWRASWRATGGGVLMSQAIHQIDTLIWLGGLPSRVSAWARRARHQTQVEDDVIAMLEYPNGARGTLVASTTDPIGTDSVTIHGERASLVVEGFRLRRAVFGDGAQTAQQRSDDSTEEFDDVPVEWTDVVEPGGGSEWFDMLLDCHRNFASAITDGTPVQNPIDQGLQAIGLVNALYLSAVRDEPVMLPTDPDEYAAVFEKLCSDEVELPR